MTPSPKKKPASDEESGEDFAADLDNVSADEDEPEDEEDAPKKRKVSLSIYTSIIISFSRQCRISMIVTLTLC